MGIIRKIKTVASRLTLDYGNADNLPLYKQILEAARTNNYKIITCAEHAALAGSKTNAKRYLVLRHDIDTDTTCSLKFSEIERSVDAFATYYFRNSTAKPDVVRTIAEIGHDVAYHCEDLATVAKRHAVSNSQQMMAHLKEAQREAAINIQHLSDLADKPIRHASSHGDFMNRKMQLTNRPVFDAAFRKANNIDFEAYDEDIMANVTFRISDAVGANAACKQLLEAFNREEPMVYFLSHPRLWRSGRMASLSEDFTRVREGASLALRRTLTRS